MKTDTLTGAAEYQRSDIKGELVIIAFLITKTPKDSYVLLIIWKRSPFLNVRSSDVLAS